MDFTKRNEINSMLAVDDKRVDRQVPAPLPHLHPGYISVEAKKKKNRKEKGRKERKKQSTVAPPGSSPSAYPSLLGPSVHGLPLFVLVSVQKNNALPQIFIHNRAEIRCTNARN